MADVELALLIDRFMRRIHMALQEKAPTFDTEKVGPGGGLLLLTLAELGPIEMHELTRRVARDKSQMSRMIGSLETKGLVVRTGSDSDGRVSIVALTGRGEGVVDTLNEVLTETINDLLAPIDASEKAVLRELMRRIVP